jgi:hypothetical protein
MHEANTRKPPASQQQPTQEEQNNNKNNIKKNRLMTTTSAITQLGAADRGRHGRVRPRGRREGRAQLPVREARGVHVHRALDGVGHRERRGVRRGRGAARSGGNEPAGKHKFHLSRLQKTKKREWEMKRKESFLKKKKKKERKKKKKKKKGGGPK